MDIQSQSPLFKLPPELRNSIYEFTFQNTTTVIYSIPKFTQARCSSPGLLTTCKQAYQEAIGFYYSRTLFEVHIHRLARPPTWIDQYIPRDYAALVKRVKVVVHRDDHRYVWLNASEIESYVKRKFLVAAFQVGADLDILKVVVVEIQSG